MLNIDFIFKKTANLSFLTTELSLDPNQWIHD